MKSSILPSEKEPFAVKNVIAFPFQLVAGAAFGLTYLAVIYIDRDGTLMEKYSSRK